MSPHSVGSPRPTHATDAAGHEAWSLQWSGTSLVHARLRLPDGTSLVLRPRTAEHAVLGVCDAIARAEEPEVVLARVAAVSWHDPACIPAVDVPGALPAGAGTAILNLLAVLARHAGTTSLRYHGPYPTSALFSTLQSSFRVVGEPARAHEVFVGEAEQHGFGRSALSPAVDFVPDPHVWSWPAPRICVQSRAGIERVWIDGRAYDPQGEHHALVRDADGWLAQMRLAGEPWCAVLRLDHDGLPRGEIEPPPAVTASLVGVALPAAMIEVLTEVVVAQAAAPLRLAIAHELARGITLGDTGMAVTRAGQHGLIVHASLVERALGLPAAESIAVLATAVRPAVVRAAVARLLAEFANDSN